MSIAQSLLPEFDNEMANTRKLLERVPENPEWRPHPKSTALGALALHLANLPSWATMTLNTTELDINPPGGSGAPRPTYESREATLATFDKNVAEARAAIAAAGDADMLTPWTFKNGGVDQFTIPRIAVLRSFVLSHMIHHRGQLTVYLRLNDVPLPSIYGPTADMLAEA